MSVQQMIEFDKDKTARFFNKVYKETDADRDAKPRLHYRDEIFLKYLLPPSARILDYGCGAGRFLSELLARGYDAVGVEKHEDMRQLAPVILGGLEVLSTFPNGSFDIVVAMGVFQYLTKEEYNSTLKEFRRILKPGGTMVATYQNAFFDLYTFNKYTVEFMDKHFGADVRGLITNPNTPAYSKLRARDNIFVHTTNPLTLGKHLKTAGFELQDKYFYEYFGLPPILGKKETPFEVDRATAWQGHFMANAFLVHSTTSPKT